MTTRAAQPSRHQIYPKRYFDAAPTWFQWNRLSASQIHALREERGFEGQNIYFCLNNPIRFVRLVGLIVDVELKANKYLLLTIDDSSGACIEVKTELRKREENDVADFPSNTLVDSLDAIAHWGVPTLLINKQPADIGTVVRLKGTIDTFRKVRQLKLERAWIVKDTNEEATAWSEVAKWERDVLSKPWVLTQTQREEIDEKIRREELKERERRNRNRASDLERAERRRRRQEKKEERRKRLESELDAGALAGSHLVPDRITDG